MKQIILLLSLTFFIPAKSQSFLAESPTFIGKTLKEILSLNKTFNNNFSSEKADTLFTLVTFVGNNSETTYMFNFNKGKICVGMITLTSDKIAGEAMLKDIEKKCHEKLSDKAFLQKPDGKNYIWNIQSTGEHYAYSSSESK